jgi:hypothetical protein
MNDLQPPARTLLGSLLSSFSRSRRLEDRIRTLSAQAMATDSDSAEMPEILEQLQAALRDHVDRMRKSAAGHPLPLERRRS